LSLKFSNANCYTKPSVHKFSLLFHRVLGSRDVRSLFGKENEAKEFIDMKNKCVEETEKQIKKEVTAAMKYLSMAAYFSRDNVNRPGFAKMFFEAASEEREHAYKLIEYLAMRGRYMNDNTGTSKSFGTKVAGGFSELVRDAAGASALGLGNELKSLDDAGDSTSGLVALQNALKMEVAVTKSIRQLVKDCEDDEMNHYHVSQLNFHSKLSL
jgi:ferritin